MTAENSVANLQWVENRLYRLLRDGVRERCMVDVGAHHGTSLEPFLRSGWRCFAFEPIEANRDQLRASFLDNPLLVVRAEAVSDKPGTGQLQLALNLDGSLHEYHHSLERIREDAWHRKGPTVEVPLVSLDSLIAAGELPPRAGFLKVDTEGHDLAVLRGATRLECETISVEFWNDGHAFGPSPSPAADMIRLLAQRGYPWFIGLSHHLDQTELHYSNLDGLRPESWGNLVFFHRSRTDLYDAIRNDPEWLFVVEQSRAFDRLNTSLREKEAVIGRLLLVAEERSVEIQTLSAAAEERLELIQGLSATAAERQTLIRELSATAAERGALIQELTARVLQQGAAIGGLAAAVRELREGLSLQVFQAKQEVNGVVYEQFAALRAELARPRGLKRVLRGLARRLGVHQP
jgi:FkbM family methyltransferase